MRFVQIVTSAIVLGPVLAQTTASDEGDNIITIFNEGGDVPNPDEVGNNAASITTEESPATTADGGSGGDISLFGEEEPMSTTTEDGIISIFNEGGDTTTTTEDGIISIFNEGGDTTTTTEDGSNIISILDQTDSTTTADAGLTTTAGDPTATVTQTATDTLLPTQTLSTLLTQVTPTQTPPPLAQNPMPLTVLTELVTIVTTYDKDYVFYCPGPTVYVNKNQSYTATEATWLTITNCPCVATITTPVAIPQTVLNQYAVTPSCDSFMSVIIPTATIAEPSQTEITIGGTEVIVNTQMATDTQIVDGTYVVTNTQVVGGTQVVQATQVVDATQVVGATQVVEATKVVDTNQDAEGTQVVAAEVPTASETVATAGAIHIEAGLAALLIPAAIALML